MSRKRKRQRRSEGPEKVAWTMQEMNVLSENYSRLKPEALMQLLPGRTWRAITGKARRLLLSVYPEPMSWLQLLRDNPGRRKEWYAAQQGTCETTARKYIRLYNHALL